MLIYDYNSDFHKFKKLHDETGGQRASFAFQFYDCFCGASEYRIVATATRHRNPFNVVQCQNCGTLRINPYLSDASIARYYREVYGPVKRGNMTPEALFTQQERSSEELYQHLRPYLPERARILDYGSGAGGRMAAFQNAGCEVFLQDYDRSYLEYGLARGMQEHREDMRYDLIVLSHVLEHINHPRAFIEQLGMLLAEGGKLYIEVPMLENNRSLLADLQLAHKFYFTAASLAYLGALAGYDCTHACHNALLMTRGHAQPERLQKQAKISSDQTLRRAWMESRITALRLWIRSLFRG